MEKILITRPGIIEMISISKNITGPQGLKKNKGPSLKINAGFYCESENCEKVFNSWKTLYIDAMNNSKEIHMIPHWWNKDKCIYSPLLKKIGVNNSNIKVYPTDPLYYINLLEKLTAKQKVLIIFPFKKSFEKNIKKLNLIYPNNKINIKNLSVIETPQTNFPPYPHKNWEETYLFLTKKISKESFDVALLSCGCYGHPLCEYIYSSLNKSAIYIGGRLQLCFGILGSRWNNRPEVKPLINSHWSYPNESERPKDYKKIEYGCYW